MHGEIEAGQGAPLQPPNPHLNLPSPPTPRPSAHSSNYVFHTGAYTGHRLDRQHLH